MGGNSENMEGFSLEAGEEVIIIIHGFTSTPSAVKPLAQELQKKGFSVVVPRLPGHGTHPDDLLRVTWEDWKKAIHETTISARHLYGKVHCLGVSMGGNLAITCAAEHPENVEKIICLGTPIFLRRKTFIRAALPILSRLKKFHKENLHDHPEGAKYYAETGAYSVWPYKGLKELLRGIEETKKALSHIVHPIYTIQSLQDPLIHPKSSAFIMQTIKTPDERKKQLLLNDNQHI